MSPLVTSPRGRICLSDKNDTVSEMEENIEIRKLPSIQHHQLSQILDIENGWKELMSSVPDLMSPTGFKYTMEHIRLVEEASAKTRRSCAAIFLDEWGTSGRKPERPCVPDLIALLKKVGLYRAADYLSGCFGKSVSRPIQGPAARVEIPDIPEATAPPFSINDSGMTTARVQTDSPRRNANDLVLSRTHEAGTTHFSHDEITSGTENFSESLKLGSGGFGTVYTCHLADNQLVAVKRFHPDPQLVELSLDPASLFRNEIQIVASLSHPHILPLIGFSCDGPDLCIVYSYMVNGSLQDRLELKSGTAAICWRDRHMIALGVADGLLYLHSATPRPLIHRDIKSANILLDHDLCPKIGDFGLTRPGSNAVNPKTQVQTSKIMGTVAYMAPEAIRAGDVSVKMDVFSFGVVLMELVTGLMSSDETRETSDLLTLVEETDDIEALYDKKPQIVNLPIIHGLYEVAQKCVLDKKRRPTVSETLVLLKEIHIE